MYVVLKVLSATFISWLVDCGVNTVAMESIGMYWYHLYTIILDNSIEVYLVNTYHV